MFTLCSTSGAYAAIDLGSTGLSDNIKLFMSAWDPVRHISYTCDLGVHFEDFLAMALDSSQRWLGVDNTVWNNVFAASSRIGGCGYGVAAEALFVPPILPSGMCPVIPAQLAMQNVWLSFCDSRFI